ncbi:MAG: energy-coupling factor transporter ATPase [Methanomassiliicoccales archaeon]|jgi:energy-coupling factor transport system ATP-binding protein
MISVKNLTFSYSDCPVPCLRDVSLEIGTSEFVLLTGPSGSGKSTLCRTFNGLVPHFYGGKMSGQISVCGKDPMRCDTKDMALKVGMVFQDPENQIVASTVEREIAFGLENLGLSKTHIAKRIEEVLDTIGVADLRKKGTDELSGGEKQKIAIASVMAMNPEVLVLDEPTSSLDPISADDVLQIIRSLNHEFGITVVLTEHRIDRVVSFVDRVIYMSAGQISFDGTPKGWVEAVDEQEYGLPQMIELGRYLTKKGLLSDVPLSVKEGRQRLSKVFSEHWNGSSNRADPLRPNGDTILNFDKVSFRYGKGTAVLRDVDLRVGKGEFVAIIGRNASGKSTLAKHINATLLPTKGEVSVLGRNTRDTNTADLSAEVGMVFQNPNMHLFASTVYDEIAFILNNHKVPEDEVEKKVDLILERFDLTRYQDTYPRDLSGGERQRVALASVLVSEPKILVLDEPTRGMEYRRKRRLMEYLSDYHSRGGTVILISHDMELIAQEPVQRVVMMGEGKIVADGSRKEILAGSLYFSPQINRLVQPFESKGVPGDILTMEEIVCGLR